MDMNTPKKTLVKVKNYLNTNKAAYAASAVALIAIAMQQRNRVMFNAFLIEKGIDPEEYYCPESYEEKMNQA